jgi:ABC-type dipeptide/oligopeptide/nickel transport system permease component
VINTFATAMTVIPGFVIAVALILMFSARIRLLPSGGWGGPEHLVLPVIAYCLGPMSTLIRYIRGLTLDELGLDYVRTARAKGLAERLIIPKHVFKNLMIPLITVFGPTIPLILTGSVFIETTFRIPGLGQYLVSSSVNRDYPMVMALTLIIAVIWGITLLVTDLLYAKLDPRVEL